MPYLVAALSNQTKSYTVTDTCNKPRIAVGGSYIPLTTSSGGGVKVSGNGSTFRAMEYVSTSSSQSASASYLTTANSPNGLSNVTNLTRVSTSNTIYLTRQSISGYGTRTVPIYQTASTWFAETRCSWSDANSSKLYTTYWDFHNPPAITNISEITGTYAGTVSRITITFSSYDSCVTKYTISTNGSTLSLSTQLITRMGQNNTTIGTGNAYVGNYTMEGVRTASGNLNRGLSTFSYNMTWQNNTYTFLCLTKAKTTGTITETQTTATLTRASTSGTVYETRVSTSGYSGVSSSSSSESASTMTWA